MGGAHSKRPAFCIRYPGAPYTLSLDEACQRVDATGISGLLHCISGQVLLKLSQANDSERIRLICNYDHTIGLTPIDAQLMQISFGASFVFLDRAVQGWTPLADAVFHRADDVVRWFVHTETFAPAASVVDWNTACPVRTTRSRSCQLGMVGAGPNTERNNIDCPMPASFLAAGNRCRCRVASDVDLDVCRVLNGTIRPNDNDDNADNLYTAPFDVFLAMCQRPSEPLHAERMCAYPARTSTSPAGELCDSLGRTRWHYVVWNATTDDDISIIQEQLRKAPGVFHQPRDVLGMSPLMFGVRCGASATVIQTVLAHDPPARYDDTDSMGNTMFHLAAERADDLLCQLLSCDSASSVSQIQILLTSTNAAGRTPLGLVQHEACAQELVQRMQTYGGALALDGWTYFDYDIALRRGWSVIAHVPNELSARQRMRALNVALLYSDQGTVADIVARFHADVRPEHAVVCALRGDWDIWRAFRDGYNCNAAPPADVDADAGENAFVRRVLLGEVSDADLSVAFRDAAVTECHLDVTGAVRLPIEHVMRLHDAVHRDDADMFEQADATDLRLWPQTKTVCRCYTALQMVLHDARTLDLYHAWFRDTGRGSLTHVALHTYDIPGAFTFPAMARMARTVWDHDSTPVHDVLAWVSPATTTTTTTPKDKAKYCVVPVDPLFWGGEALWTARDDRGRTVRELPLVLWQRERLAACVGMEHPDTDVAFDSSARDALRRPCEKVSADGARILMSLVDMYAQFARDGSTHCAEALYGVDGRVPSLLHDACQGRHEAVVTHIRTRYPDVSLLKCGPVEGDSPLTVALVELCRRSQEEPNDITLEHVEAVVAWTTKLWRLAARTQDRDRDGAIDMLHLRPHGETVFHSVFRQTVDVMPALVLHRILHVFPAHILVEPGCGGRPTGFDDDDDDKAWSPLSLALVRRRWDLVHAMVHVHHADRPDGGVFPALIRLLCRKPGEAWGNMCKIRRTCPRLVEACDSSKRNLFHYAALAQHCDGVALGSVCDVTTRRRLLAQRDADDRLPLDYLEPGSNVCLAVWTLIVKDTDITVAMAGDVLPRIVRAGPTTNPNKSMAGVLNAALGQIPATHQRECAETAEHAGYPLLCLAIDTRQRDVVSLLLRRYGVRPDRCYTRAPAAVTGMSPARVAVDTYAAAAIYAGRIAVSHRMSSAWTTFSTVLRRTGVSIEVLLHETASDGRTVVQRAVEYLLLPCLQHIAWRNGNDETWLYRQRVTATGGTVLHGVIESLPTIMQDDPSVVGILVEKICCVCSSRAAAAVHPRGDTPLHTVARMSGTTAPYAALCACMRTLLRHDPTLWHVRNADGHTPEALGRMYDQEHVPRDLHVFTRRQLEARPTSMRAYQALLLRLFAVHQHNHNRLGPGTCNASRT